MDRRGEGTNGPLRGVGRTSRRASSRVEGVCVTAARRVTVARARTTRAGAAAARPVEIDLVSIPTGAASVATFAVRAELLRGGEPDIPGDERRGGDSNVRTERRQPGCDTSEKSDECAQRAPGIPETRASIEEIARRRVRLAASAGFCSLSVPLLPPLGNPGEELARRDSDARTGKCCRGLVAWKPAERTRPNRRGHYYRCLTYSSSTTTHRPSRRSPS